MIRKQIVETEDQTHLKIHPASSSTSEYFPVCQLIPSQEGIRTEMKNRAENFNNARSLLRGPRLVFRLPRNKKKSGHGTWNRETKSFSPPPLQLHIEAELCPPTENCHNATTFFPHTLPQTSIQLCGYSPLCPFLAFVDALLLQNSFGFVYFSSREEYATDSIGLFISSIFKPIAWKKWRNDRMLVAYVMQIDTFSAHRESGQPQRNWGKKCKHDGRKSVKYTPKLRVLLSKGLTWFDLTISYERVTQN